MRRIFNLVFLLGAFALSGCATLFVKNVKTITVTSEPSGAEVKDMNGKISGSTPYAFTPSKNETYSLIISKPGYKDAPLQIRPVVNEGALLADALLLCIPCIIDIPSKAYLQFPKPDYNIQLELNTTLTDNSSSILNETILLNVEEPQIHFKDRTVLGEVNGAKKKYRQEEPEEYTGNSIFYTEGICSEFEKFDVTTVQCGLNRYAVGNGSLIPPEKQLYIAAEIQSYNFNLKHKSRKYFGTGSITVNWKVKDPLSGMKVILEKTTSVTSDVEERQAKYLFKKMLERSANRFITQDSLLDFLRNRMLLSPALMKGEIVSLKKVSNPAFEKFKDLVSHCTKAVVTIKQGNGHGSGVIISSSGLIVTNYHVVEESKEVKVKLNSSISLTAKVIKTNPAVDLALLKVDAQDIPVLPFSMSESSLGDEVIAIGTPGDISLEQTVSKGIISGKRIFDGKKFWQTDVSINPGNSGGPLINEKGEITGIITMKLIGREMEGLGFALTSEEVINALNLKIE